MKRLKNIVLFFAAPFIALIYIIILPFFGLYMFINLAIEAIHKHITEKKLYHGKGLSSPPNDSSLALD